MLDLSKLLHKNKDTREYYFSLIPDIDHVSVAIWYIDHDHLPNILCNVTGQVPEDSWESRIKVIDSLLSTAEDRAHIEKPIAKTVYGLPGIYLGPDGNIANGIRPHLKKLSELLELSPVGFVPLYQAYAHKITADEGVPASVILLGISGDSVSLTLYRVGQIVHQETLHGVDIVNELETSLKSQQDGGVLPSRILLLGGNTQVLEEIRTKLMKHPWPTRTNFLHFPKIEIITTDLMLASVSLAGSAELANTIGEDAIADAPAEAETVIAQPTAHTSEEDVANVEMVTPESLGFQNGDILDVGSVSHQPQIPKNMFLWLKNVRLPKIRMPRMKGAMGLIAVSVLLILFLFGYGLYYFLPHATVTVFVSPISFSESQALIVDPEVLTADLSSQTVPGSTIEKSVQGDKTIQVTGKKKIGDPAKGTITLYNKVTNEKNLQKGTVVTGKGLSFTLDSSVSIASASESIGSITFGKADVTVTASAIGAEGNLPADTEFTVKDQSSSSVSARNNSAFSGGSSKEVTVVTRADYDNLTKLLTDELIEKAKKDLLADATQGTLIDGTITTKVTEKVFDEELDQEAKQLHGNMTVSVKGIALDSADIKELLLSIIQEKMPAGYERDETQDTLETSKATVKKDGKITVEANFTAVAVPKLDTNSLKSSLAGKKIIEAESLLRETSGVASAEFRFQFSPTRNKLPINRKNITVTVAVQP